MIRYLILFCIIILTCGQSRAQQTYPHIDPQRGVMTIAPLIKQVTPSVVNISVQSRNASKVNPLLRDPFFRRFFKSPRHLLEQEIVSAGSGVIVDAEHGYVMTNAHIVRNAEHITIILKDQHKLTARFVGKDDATDLAVLQIPAENLTAIELGDSDKLEIGDFVVAIGNPFSWGQTVTSGIISALGQSNLSSERQYQDFIQTDAPINPGNSGGALVNTRGELIGINTALLAPKGGNVGIGFAVPSNIVSTVMRQLIQYGEVRRGFIGVVVQDLTSELVSAFNVPVQQGIIITDVQPQSPAQDAGLQAGDVIIALNDITINSADSFYNRIRVREGEVINISYYREQELLSTPIHVQFLPQQKLQGKDLNTRLSGSVFTTIPDHLRQYRNVNGVYISALLPGSEAWKTGLRQHDIILSVNRWRVTSLEDFVNAMSQVRSPMQFIFIRNGKRLRLIVRS